MKLKIVSNYHWRPIISWYDLTDKEQAEFDYFDVTYGAGNFVRYRGHVYDLSEFTFNAPKPWDLIYTDTFFSAVLVCISDDCEYAQIGMAYSME